MRKITFGFLLTILVAGFMLPAFSFAQKATQTPQIPNAWDEIFAIGKRALLFIPNTLKATWQEAVRIWLKMATFFDNIWDKYIFSKIEWIWHKTFGIFNKEVEKRKETLPGELEKEKQEIKTETTKTGKSLWQKIKDIVPGI